ncbi:MAG: hypothetical protein WD294_02260 [Phycisphaeraceae bacterium]
MMFKPKNLRRTLLNLQFDMATARGIEGLLMLWDVMFLSHPIVDNEIGSDPPIARDEWERLYADQSAFDQAMPVPPERIEKINAQVRMADSFSPLAKAAEFAPDSDLQQTPFALFFRRVLGPYIAWHVTEPWADFRAACAGDDKALCRLIEIDPSVQRMSSIQQAWASQLKADRNLRERVRDAAKRKLRDKVAGVESREIFEDATRKRIKLRLAAELQRWIERRFLEHPEIAPKRIRRQKRKPNESQLRQIFNAYAEDTRGTPKDADLPESDGTFRKDIANYRNRLEKALHH